MGVWMDFIFVLYIGRFRFCMFICSCFFYDVELVIKSSVMMMKSFEFMLRI